MDFKFLQKTERAFGFKLLWLSAWGKQNPQGKHYKEPGDLLETGWREIQKAKIKINIPPQKNYPITRPVRAGE